jgi:hypothetical protein
LTTSNLGQQGVSWRHENTWQKPHVLRMRYTAGVLRTQRHLEFEAARTLLEILSFSFTHTGATQVGGRNDVIYPLFLLPLYPHNAQFF